MKRLVRGLDAIPDHIESASACRAARDLSLATGAINRMIARSPKGKRRALLRLQRMVRNGANYVTGGFEVDDDGNLI